MKSAVLRVWRRLNRDMQAHGRLTTLLPPLVILAALWALQYSDASTKVKDWLTIPLALLAFLWVIYAQGHEFARMRRLSGESKFRSQWTYNDSRICPDCAWDLPDDFDTSHGALNECPECGALLDRMGHPF